MRRGNNNGEKNERKEDGAREHLIKGGQGIEEPRNGNKTGKKEKDKRKRKWKLAASQRHEECKQAAIAKVQGTVARLLRGIDGSKWIRCSVPIRSLPDSVHNLVCYCHVYPIHDSESAE